ncbi:tRNA lysidine(34) synthetase TilS [Rhizobium binxianense]
MSPEAILSPEAAIRRFVASLASPARILVAISGGSDSTGLLLLLTEALKAASHPSISLCAATVDHALRAGSVDEALEVAALCGSLGIPHVTCLWQGEKPKSGIMAAAREARYGLLAAAAESLSADLVVTAHTLDDQRETLAMRSSRAGEGSTGIADAVLFDRRIWIFRPLLGCLRADIRAFLQARGVAWIEDPSNEDMRYERVRTRRRLSEEGDADEIPDIRETERLLLAERAAGWLGRHFRLHGVLGHVSSEGLEAGEAILDYALGRLTAVFGGRPFPPGRAQMRDILAFVAAGEPDRMTAGRVVFDLRRDGLYLARESRGILPLIVPPGGCGVWDGRFEVHNGSPTSIKVEAAATPTPSFLMRGEWGEGLPKAAWKRAVAASPVVLTAGGEVFSAESAQLVHLTPYFAPFDRFLTRFDLTFADRLSVAFARAPYARLPLRSIDGKTT